MGRHARSRLIARDATASGRGGPGCEAAIFPERGNVDRPVNQY
jgi:hypothetical protein